MWSSNGGVNLGVADRLSKEPKPPQKIATMDEFFYQLITLPCDSIVRHGATASATIGEFFYQMARTALKFVLVPFLICLFFIHCARLIASLFSRRPRRSLVASLWADLNLLRHPLTGAIEVIVMWLKGAAWLFLRGANAPSIKLLPPSWQLGISAGTGAASLFSSGTNLMKSLAILIFIPALFYLVYRVTCDTHSQLLFSQVLNAILSCQWLWTALADMFVIAVFVLMLAVEASVTQLIITIAFIMVLNVLVARSERMRHRLVLFAFEAMAIALLANEIFQQAVDLAAGSN